MKTWRKKVLYFIEYLLLFFGVPLLLFFESKVIHPSSLLLPVLGGLIFYFRKQRDFHLKELFILNIPSKIWRQQIPVLLLSGLFLLAYVLVFEPNNLFNLPRNNPLIWIGLFFFYPVFSAFGQEVLYRVFFFRRYRKLYTKPWTIILFSALAFSFVHIIYFSVLSLILTFIAGLYLSWIYYKFRSVLFTSILHGILGFLIFTLGLGQHFWLDMMNWL